MCAHTKYIIHFWSYFHIFICIFILSWLVGWGWWWWLFYLFLSFVSFVCLWYESCTTKLLSIFDVMYLFHLNRLRHLFEMHLGYHLGSSNWMMPIFVYLSIRMVVYVAAVVVVAAAVGAVDVAVALFPDMLSILRP